MSPDAEPETCMWCGQATHAHCWNGRTNARMTFRRYGPAMRSLVVEKSSDLADQAYSEALAANDAAPVAEVYIEVYVRFEEGK